MKRVPVTLIEMPEFLRLANEYLADDERSELLYYVGSDPEKGAVITGTGGVRKLRWAPNGQGKSGGYRVIYFFYNETMPVFMLSLYPKNEKDDLSKADCNALRKAMPLLVKGYKAGKWKKK